MNRLRSALQSAISNQQSAISNQQSAISNQQSAISNQQSAISNQQSSILCAPLATFAPWRFHLFPPNHARPSKQPRRATALYAALRTNRVGPQPFTRLYAPTAWGFSPLRGQMPP
jgi:hypothetical protein